MSSSRARSIYSISAIVVLTLCLVIESAHSAPGPQTKDGKQKGSPAESRGTHQVGHTKAAAKREADKTRDSLGGSKKFQVRMGGEQQQLAQLQSAQGPVHSESYYLGADSWNPHSLVPTFTDQEQGDEMVALASDSEPDYFKALNTSGSSVIAPNDAIHKYDHRYHESSLPAGLAQEKPSESGAGASQPVGGKQRQQQAADEYYSDDEEDEDDASIKGLRGEFESVTNQQRDNRKEVSSKLRALQQAESGQYTDDSVAQQLSAFDQKYRSAPVESQLQINQTSTQATKQQPASAQDARWLPSSDTQLGSSIDLNQPLAASQQQFASEQQRVREVAASQAAPGEKLTSFFGGRDSFSPFSKTDAAIEYLKSLLKAKQSSRNNSTSDLSAGLMSESAKQQVDQAASPVKGSNLQRLSSFATKLNQMLNTTAPTHLVVSNSTAKFDYSQPQSENSAPQQQPLAQPGGASRLSASAQLTDAKFSIVDAKPLVAPTDGFYQSYATPTSTSKPAATEERKSARQQPPPLNPVESVFVNTQAEPSKPEPYSQEFSPASTLNGTPLGGEYVESLDEFPRALRQQQQRQFFPAESRLIPVVQQDSKQPGQPATLVESGAQVKESAQKQAQPSSGADPLNFERDALEAFQRQLSGVPSSSKYFQLHRPTPDYLQRPSEKLSPYLEAANVPSPAVDTREQAQIFEHLRPAAQPQQHYQNTAANQSEQVAPARKPVRQEDSKRPQVIVHHEQAQPMVQSLLEQHRAPQAPISGDKIYSHAQAHPAHLPAPHKPPSHHQYQYQYPPTQIKQAPIPAEPVVRGGGSDPKAKPPKIVSYNYFESPTETGESELLTTNYQLGDTLYSSTGGVEQILSNSELEAIQNQFLTVEHPIVPINPADHGHPFSSKRPHASHPDHTLSGLLANLKPNLQPDTLQKLSSPAKQAEDALKELSSNEDQVAVAAPHGFNLPRPSSVEHHAVIDHKRPPVKGVDASDAKKKRKSLIVYLNHPRPVDMSKVSSSPEEGYSLSQSIGDPQSESMISAKEFDVHGLSKDTKHLDISSLKEFGDLKDKQDKDGLSVVVIGDAYKYKKIVLLISSKSGGLKFIPMVKDMKK